MTTLAVPLRPSLDSSQGNRIPQPNDLTFGLLTTTLMGQLTPPSPQPDPLGKQRGRWPAPAALSRSAPRTRILAQLVQTPGLHLRALRRRLDIELSTLEHHLRVLGRQGHAATCSFGRYKAFYPCAGVDRRDWAILFFLRQEHPGRILLLLTDDHSADHTSIAAELGIPPTTCYFHLKKLHEADLLEREHSGHHILWSLREPRHVAALVGRYQAA